MKTPVMLFALTLVTACSPTGEGTAPAPDATNTPAPAASSEPAPAPAPAPSAASTASATGVVEAVDPAAKTITIAHGPVDALKWPAMTMAFKAPDADLSAIKQGDHVTFEFTSSGMDGTITTITRQ